MCKFVFVSVYLYYVYVSYRISDMYITMTTMSGYVLYISVRISDIRISDIGYRISDIQRRYPGYPGYPISDIETPVIIVIGNEFGVPSSSSEFGVPEFRSSEFGVRFGVRSWSSEFFFRVVDYKYTSSKKWRTRKELCECVRVLFILAPRTYYIDL